MRFRVLDPNPLYLAIALAIALPTNASGAGPLPALSRIQAADTARLAVTTDTARHELDPGASGTLRVIVRDLASRDQIFVLSTTVPAGWRLLTQPTETRVPANGRAIRLVQIAAPHDAAAGEYHIIHSVRAPGLDTDIEAQSVVVVRARRSISVALLDEPYFAATGSTFRTTFVVSNLGNVRTRVRLHARTEQDLSAKIDTLTELGPGEKRQVSVVVEAGLSSTSEDSRHHVTLVAEAEGGLSGDGTAIPQAVASIRVVPRSEDAGMPWYSLPFALSINSTQTQQTNAIVGGRSHAFEFAGTGPLTEGSSTTLDVFARGPHPDHSSFGERDEYRIGLTGPDYSVRVGDQMFRLTPLSDAGSFSSGVSGQVSHGEWTAGGQVARDRWIAGHPAQQAAFVAFDPRVSVHFSANVLESNQFGGSTLGTLYARTMLTSKSLLEVERGTGLRGVGAGATATLVRAAGDHGWIAFELHHTRADSAYGSGLRGLGQNLATVTLRPVTWLRFSARTEQLTRSPEGISLNISQLQPPLQVVRNSSVAADMAGILSAGLRTSSSVGGASALFTANSGGGEKSAWARIGANVRSLSISATAESGVLSDLVGGPNRTFARTRIQAGLRITSHASFGGFVERSSGPRLYAPVAQDVVIAGGSAQLQYRALALVLTGTAAPSSRFRVIPDTNFMIPGATAWIDGAAVYSLSAGRSFSLRVRTVGGGPLQPLITTARVAYNMPLRLPIGRSRTQARVLGRVYDAETGDGISNALVRIGDRVGLTDDQGRVAFGRIAPNQYPVNVDLGSHQSDGVGFADAGLEVAAQAGRTTEIGVRVTRLGRITGNLTLFERVDSPFQTADSSQLRRARGLGGIVISLMNGSEERRVLSNADGSFELRDARPGIWRVVVPSAQLPPQTSIEGDSARVVDLAVGVTRTIEFNVVPHLRKILPLDVAPGNPPPFPTPAALPPLVSASTAVATTPDAAANPARAVAPKAIPIRSVGAATRPQLSVARATTRVTASRQVSARASVAHPAVSLLQNPAVAKRASATPFPFVDPHQDLLPLVRPGLRDPVCLLDVLTTTIASTCRR